MSNLLDNALAALNGQDAGLLKIVMVGMESQSIMIANTLHRDIDIERLYATMKVRRGLHGYGLKRVREIVFQHPGIELFTYKSGRFQGREILVQHIKITPERG